MLSGDQNKLVLVVSDKPEAFAFIDSIRLADSGACRVAPSGAESFPENWRDLDVADIVVLDAAPNQSFSGKQRKALMDWVVAGGTVLLTPEALRAGRLPGSWGLFDEAEIASRTRDVDCPALRLLLRKFADHLDSVPVAGLMTPPSLRVLWEGAETLIAAKEVGRGRVVAIGLDWAQVQIDERIVFEGFRRELWLHLLSLSAKREDRHMRSDLVTPREAMAKHLAWYVIGFLACYALVLGLGNWLVLRGFRRLEYAVFTLPAGALVFAFAAFGVGLLLRGEQTLVNEMEVVQYRNGETAFSEGMVGVLAADRRPFSFITADPMAVMDFTSHNRVFYGYDRSGQQPAHYTFTPSVQLDGMKMGMWTMGYLRAHRTVDFGEGLDTQAAFSGSNVVVSVTSRLPFILADAYAVFGWHRAAIGDLAPGETRTVTMPLISQDKLQRSPCPNCGRYHGDGWFSERFAKYYPISEELRKALEALHGSQIDSNAFVAGWRRETNMLVRVDRELTVQERSELCVVHLDVGVTGGSVSLPLGIVNKWWEVSPTQGGLGRFPHQQFAYQHLPLMTEKLGVRPSEESSAQLTARRSRERKERMLAFSLPYSTNALRTTRIDVRWVLPAGDGPYQPSPVVLSVFDWEEDTWADLCTAREGTNNITLSEPTRFVYRPAPTLVLRMKRDTEAQHYGHYFGTTEIAWDATVMEAGAEE